MASRTHTPPRERDRGESRASTPPRSRALAGASPDRGTREWRSVGKHPSLELKHTVDDRVMVATSAAYLPFRAMLHRNRDRIVCYSQVIREITSSGGSQADRVLVITDKNMYVVQVPSAAFFAPPATGGCFSLSDFGRMALVTGTQHCLFQFVGATIAMRFSSTKDAQRCGSVMFSLTAIPVESIAPTELGSLHARRVLGAPNSLSQSIAAAREAAGEESEEGSDRGTDERQSAAQSGANRSSQQAASGKPQGQQGTVAATKGGGSSVDNMLRFILESNENNVYESLFPEVGIQTEVETDECGVQSAPTTRDAATSPIRKRDYSPGRYGRHESSPSPAGHHMNMSSTRKFDADYAESEDSGSVLSEFDSGAMWRSLQRSQTQPGAPSNASPAIGATPRPTMSSSRHAGPTETSAPGSPQASGSTVTFDGWLGILTQYKDGLAEQGIDSIGKLVRLAPHDLDEVMDRAGISRAGHRVLLSSKINVAKQSKGRR